MLPLRLVVLWHYHQPEYRWQGQAMLPWVRLRAVKDYALLFRLFARLPQSGWVLNVSPVLLVQLAAYAAGEVEDVVERFSRSATFSEAEREYWRMVEPPVPLRKRFPVVEELWQGLARGDGEPQQWWDLRMWGQLLWAFPHRKDFPQLEEWFRRERGFRREDLQGLLCLQRLLVQEALEALRELVQSGTVELSCSPFSHPVLPLLCDTDSARESDPGLPLPDPPFRFPEDAWLQCLRARQCCWELLGVMPEGMWPSEGALSLEALQQLAAAGVRWVATDEALLFSTLAEAPAVQKYLPHRLVTPSGTVVVFFRDRQLSDAIGFVYGDWAAERAVEDMVQRLWAIRAELLQVYGEAGLRSAAVTLALDGENCWDGYADNGVAFLRLLSERLAAEPWLQVVTCQEVLRQGVELFPELPRLRTGSWVEGSLRIWVGTPRHNRAWEELGAARAELERARRFLPPSRWREALEHVLIAEGSDWFWWQSPERPTPAAPLFEQLFRLHLEQVFRTTALLERARR